MKNIQTNEAFYRGFIKYLRENKKIEIGLEEDDLDDQEAIQIIGTGLLEYMAVTLAENVSENEDVSIELPEYLTLTASYRDGEGGGNFGIGAVVGSEIKKRIKNDAALEELDD